MSTEVATTDFRSVILDTLRKNNDDVFTSYGPLMKAYEELLETIFVLKIKQQQENVGASSSANVSFLEKKLSELQRELTDMYKRRSENAQNLLDATRKLELKDAEIVQLKRKLEEAEEKNVCLSKTNLGLQDNLNSLEQTNNHLKDEYTELQLLKNVLEQKYKNVQEENEKLCTRYLELKLKEADVMNLENTWQQKLRELNLQHQLAEATKEQITVPAQLKNEPEMAQEAAVALGRNKSNSFSRQFNISVVPSHCKHKLEAHDGEVNAVQWSQRGKFLATGGADRRIKLWNFDEDKPQCLTKLDGCNSAVTSISFDPDDSLLACSSNDFGVRLWTLSTQRLSIVFSGHSNKVQTVKFIGSSGRLVSGSHDRTLKVWDMRARCCSKTLFAGSICNDLVAGEASPGANVISGHYDKKLRFWDTRCEKAAFELVMSNKISGLDLSTDSRYLLCCTRDDQLLNIDLRTNQVLKTFTEERFKTGSDFTRCCMSPDQQLCAAGSSQGQIFIWDVASAQLQTR